MRKTGTDPMNRKEVKKKSIWLKIQELLRELSELQFGYKSNLSMIAC